jgi:hypothetical protein
VALLALAASTGCGGGGDEAAFCDSFAELNKPDEEALTVEQGLSAVDELAETAPDGVRDAASTARDGLHGITDAVTGAGFELSDIDNPEALSDKQRTRMEAASEGADVDRAAITQAFADMEAWTTDNC